MEGSFNPEKNTMRETIMAAVMELVVQKEIFDDNARAIFLQKFCNPSVKLAASVMPECIEIVLESQGEEKDLLGSSVNQTAKFLDESVVCTKTTGKPRDQVEKNRPLKKQPPVNGLHTTSTEIARITESQPGDQNTSTRGNFKSLSCCPEKSVARTRSPRIPNVAKKMEMEYDFHLRNSTKLGLEKKWIDNNIGFGVFATKDFHEKEFLIEYEGELIDNDTGIERFNAYPAELGSFMFYLGQFHSKQWIDATADQDSLGRFINHSKYKPNAKVINKQIDGRPRIFLIAIKDITVGDQILYDYADKNPNFKFLSQ